MDEDQTQQTQKISIYQLVDRMKVLFTSKRYKIVIVDEVADQKEVETLFSTLFSIKPAE
jgi:hypothetical protein